MDLVSISASQQGRGKVWQKQIVHPGIPDMQNAVRSPHLCTRLTGYVCMSESTFLPRLE